MKKGSLKRSLEKVRKKLDKLSTREFRALVNEHTNGTWAKLIRARPLMEDYTSRKDQTR